MLELTPRELGDEDIPLLKKWLYLPHVATWYHDPLNWIDEAEKRNDVFAFLHHFIVEQDGNAKRIIVQPEQENKASCNTLLSCGFLFDENNEIYMMEL